MATPRYWIVGSMNVDLVVDVTRFPDPGETVWGTGFSTFLGGKGGNQGMALARLGTAPRMVGRVGDDQFGQRYRDELSAAGASVAYVSIDENEPTGTALIEVEGSGNNRIVVVPGANGTVSPDRVAPVIDEIAAGDILLLQLETPMETVELVAKTAHSRGVTVILDPAPAVPLSKELLKNISWLTPNEHEASVLTGIDTSTDEGLQEAAAALGEYGVDHVVIKAGGRGAWYLSSTGGDAELVAGYVVTVVDTTAAGDSFNAGLAWALGRGEKGSSAVRLASAVGALSVTGKGAQSAMPSADAVERFVAEYQ